MIILSGILNPKTILPAVCWGHRDSLSKFSGAAQKAWHLDQHGWTWPRAGAALICGAKAEQVIGTIHAWPLLLAHLALQFVFVGCGEEPGWRGWLLPRLRERYSPGVATAVLAAIWGVWHFFILLSGPRTAAVFLFGVFGLSFLFTALWEYSGGNVFLAAVAHASVNAPLTWLNEPGVLASVPSETLFETAMGVYGVLGLAFAIARRNRFFGKA